MDNNQDQENKQSSSSSPPVLHGDIQVKVEIDYDEKAPAILSLFIKKEEESDHDDDDNHTLEMICSRSKRKKNITISSVVAKRRAAGTRSQPKDVEQTCPKCDDTFSSARLMARHRRHCPENNANEKLPGFQVDLDDLDKELGPLDDDEDDESNGHDLLQGRF